MLGFWLWNRSRPFWTFSFSRMLPQPIMEIVTGSVLLCAGAAGAAVGWAAPAAGVLAGAAGAAPQAASRLAPAAPRPRRLACARKARRVRRGVGEFGESSADIGIPSFEVCRSQGQ